MTAVKQIFPIGLLVIFVYSVFVMFFAPPVPEIAGYESNSGGFVIENSVEDYSYDARIIEVVSGHAWANHGLAVNDAFKCLNNNGSTMSFKTFGFKDGYTGKDIPTNLWLCKNGDDWYAIVTTIFEKVGGNKIAKLVTAYKVSKDIFPTIESYITHITNKWGAIKISYAIEAGNIFLQPK
jgi:hypothetical protein